MSFDWTEYFKLALELDSQAKLIGTPQAQEARWRSAISRAYYSVFGRTRDLISADYGMTEDILRNHGKLHSYLQASSDPTRKEIGVQLQRMYVFRRQADYSASVNGLDRMSRDQILLAQDTFVLLDRLARQ